MQPTRRDQSHDVAFMDQAIESARLAAAHDDVPVGCVVVLDGQVIGVGENRRELDQDPSAHAEIVALRAAARHLGRWRLDEAIVYVTLEPCVMCAGALLSARISYLVIGAMDEKAGAVGSRYNVLSDPRLSHEVGVTYDVLTDASQQLLREFFQLRRT